MNATPSTRHIANRLMTPLITSMPATASQKALRCGARQNRHPIARPKTNMATCKSIWRPRQVFSGRTEALMLSGSRLTLRTLVKLNWCPLRGTSMRMGRTPAAVGLGGTSSPSADAGPATGNPVVGSMVTEMPFVTIAPPTPPPPPLAPAPGIKPYRARNAG